MLNGIVSLLGKFTTSVLMSLYAETQLSYKIDALVMFLANFQLLSYQTYYTQSIRKELQFEFTDLPKLVYFISRPSLFLENTNQTQVKAFVYMRACFGMIALFYT